MPNLDGGHYFLTVLAPIRTDDSRSHEYLLAEKLALLRTGRQTEWSRQDVCSPFALNTQNHFVRFVIINNPVFNGRMSADTLLSIVNEVDPLVAQPVDGFTKPYLVFAADIDAPEGEASVRTYTDSLWKTMSADLKEIFGYCEGFNAIDAEGFHTYIRQCQVETTMPFNDYRAAAPVPTGPKEPAAADPNKGAPKSPSVLTRVRRGLKAAAYVLGIWFVALLVNAIIALSGAGPQWLRWLTGWGAVLFIVVVTLFLLIGWVLYRDVLRRAKKPFATAPDSSLPSVLKALFVQQRFTQLAIDAQGLDENALYGRFKAFLAEVAPDRDEPTQPPGEVFAPEEPPAQLKVA
jgi:hypothetical protein